MGGMELLTVAAIAGSAASAGAAVAGGVMQQKGAQIQAQGSLMAGQEQSEAALFEEQQLNIRKEQQRVQAEVLKIQETQIRTAASQDEAARRNELTRSMEAIAVARAGRGVGAASPTGVAILDDFIAGAHDDIATARGNYASKGLEARLAGDTARVSANISEAAATMAARRARTSLLAGQMGADVAGISGDVALLTGASKAASLFTQIKKPT